MTEFDPHQWPQLRRILADRIASLDDVDQRRLQETPGLRARYIGHRWIQFRWAHLDPPVVLGELHASALRPEAIR
jgi:hypothetical protein